VRGLVDLLDTDPDGDVLARIDQLSEAEVVLLLDQLGRP
jgi:hypothetical protein